MCKIVIRNISNSITKGTFKDLTHSILLCFTFSLVHKFDYNCKSCADNGNDNCVSPARRKQFSILDKFNSLNVDYTMIITAGSRWL